MPGHIARRISGEEKQRAHRHNLGARLRVRVGGICALPGSAIPEVPEIRSPPRPSWACFRPARGPAGRRLSTAGTCLDLFRCD